MEKWNDIIKCGVLKICVNGIVMSETMKEKCEKKIVLQFYYYLKGSVILILKYFQTNEKFHLF